MAEIRPNQLPAAASVNPASAIIVDAGGPVEKATPLQVVDAARPKASQSDAETGTDNEKIMTPLRVKQAIDELADLSLRSELTSSDPGDGAEMVGYGDDYGSGTLDLRINILSATARPAMAGIFSSGNDQHGAIQDFIDKSADAGKTIEWGPLDVIFNVQNPGNPHLRGLTVPSGSRWVGHPETIFRALPNSGNNYEIVNIWDKQDIVIEGNGMRLIGDRDDHTGSTGEWGMGLSIRGSTNIRVSDLTAEDCWGDGFYIGRSDNQAFSQDIHLERIVGRNNRRQGLSLITAKSFSCVDSLFELTNGTLPEWGVDIEPNNPDEFLQDIWFVRTRTKGNAGRGFGIYPQALRGSTEPVDIHILDCMDDGSDYGFSGGLDNGLDGQVEVINFVSRNAGGNGLIFVNKAADGLRYKLVNPKIIDWNRTEQSSPVYSAGAAIYAESGNSGTHSLGGVDFINPELILNSGSAGRAIVCSDARTTTPDAPSKIRVFDPIDLADLPCWIVGFDKFADSYRASHFTLPDSNSTLGVSQGYQHFTVPPLATTRTYSINNAQPIGWEYVIESYTAPVGGNNNYARFQFPEGVSLLPETFDTNRWIYTNTPGSRLRIRKVGEMEWIVLEKTGTWTLT